LRDPHGAILEISRARGQGELESSALDINNNQSYSLFIEEELHSSLGGGNAPQSMKIL
jgi:hypothetical protein